MEVSTSSFSHGSVEMRLDVSTTVFFLLQREERWIEWEEYWEEQDDGVWPLDENEAFSDRCHHSLIPFSCIQLHTNQFSRISYLTEQIRRCKNRSNKQCFFSFRLPMWLSFQFKQISKSDCMVEILDWVEFLWGLLLFPFVVCQNTQGMTVPIAAPMAHEVDIFVQVVDILPQGKPSCPVWWCWWSFLIRCIIGGLSMDIFFFVIRSTFPG